LLLHLHDGVAVLLFAQDVHLLLADQRGRQIVRILRLLAILAPNLVIFEGPVLRAHLNSQITVLNAAMLRVVTLVLRLTLL
jgi:hypothetical protein